MDMEVVVRGDGPELVRRRVGATHNAPPLAPRSGGWCQGLVTGVVPRGDCSTSRDEEGRL